jgi:hypothetical protein
MLWPQRRSAWERRGIHVYIHMITCRKHHQYDPRLRTHAVEHILRLHLSTVDSAASVAPSRITSRGMAISAAASCVCVVPRRRKQVVF